MSSQAGCLRIAVPMSFLLSAMSTSQGATMSLQAVGHNGEPVARTSSIDVSPGDTLEVELIIEDWAPNLIRSYQATIESAGYLLCDAAGGAVLPQGWHAQCEQPAGGCVEDSDCDDPFPCLEGRCELADHGPQWFAFIDNAREDMLLILPWISPVDVSTLAYRFASTPLPLFPAVDPGTPAYGGTLPLDVLPEACGTISLGLRPMGTFMTNFEGVHIQIDLVPLTINVGAGCPGPELRSDPPNCAIDGLYPHSADSASPRLGWNAVDIIFQSDVGDLTPADFRVGCQPEPCASPAITDVQTAGKVATLTLDAPIHAQQWTCFEFAPGGVPSGGRVCLGSLPGDADGDGTSSPSDILAIIDNLNGVTDPPLEMWQCDTDRSGRCHPADILGVIDLLNGAAAFEAFFECDVAVVSE